MLKWYPVRCQIYTIDFKIIKMLYLNKCQGNIIFISVVFPIVHVIIFCIKKTICWFLQTIKKGKLRTINGLYSTVKIKGST